LNRHSNPRHGRLPSTLKLVDETGQLIGVVSLQDARTIASEKGLDLIEVSGHTDPPVYKMGDYGRMAYMEKKRNVELKKKQHAADLKEIQLRPNIQDNDYQVKMNRAKGFLIDRDKVKIVLRFRGREMAFVDAGKAAVDRMINDLAEFGKVDVPPKMEGRRILTVLSPLKVQPSSPKKGPE
jgi:translation initiation factor IF-3